MLRDGLAEFRHPLEFIRTEFSENSLEVFLSTCRAQNDANLLGALSNVTQAVTSLALHEVGPTILNVRNTLRNVDGSGGK